MPADGLADGVPDAVHPGRAQGRRLRAGAGRRRRGGHRADRAGARRRAAGLGDQPRRGQARRALELGAHEVFDSNAKLPGKVDAVMETVGRATWSHSIRSLRPGGSDRHQRYDERPEARRRRADPDLLPAAARDRLDDGHPRRAGVARADARRHRRASAHRPDAADGAGARRLRRDGRAATCSARSSSPGDRSPRRGSSRAAGTLGAAGPAARRLRGHRRGVAGLERRRRARPGGRDDRVRAVPGRRAGPPGRGSTSPRSTPRWPGWRRAATACASVAAADPEERLEARPIARTCVGCSAVLRRSSGPPAPGMIAAEQLEVSRSRTPRPRSSRRPPAVAWSAPPTPDQSVPRRPRPARRRPTPPDLAARVAHRGRGSSVQRELVLGRRRAIPRRPSTGPSSASTGQPPVPSRERPAAATTARSPGSSRPPNGMHASVAVHLAAVGAAERRVDEAAPRSSPSGQPPSCSLSGSRSPPSATPGQDARPAPAPGPPGRRPAAMPLAVSTSPLGRGGRASGRRTGSSGSSGSADHSPLRVSRTRSAVIAVLVAARR